MSTPEATIAPATHLGPQPAAGLRVALLNPCFWPEVRRGSERFARVLADSLIARGHAPRLITSHSGLPTHAVEDGLPITRLWRPPEARLRRRQFEDHLTHVPLAYLELRRGEDDLAHALHSTDALAAGHWARHKGRPAIFSYMGLPSRQHLVARRLRADVLVAAVRECTAVVALSATAADGFRRTLGVRARVIAPGVDLDAFTPSPGRAPTPEILCPAAAGQPAKRVDLLLEALACVRRSRPGTRLVLDLPRDRAVAERLRAAGADLVDLDDHEALRDAYRRAWVTALPSIGEAFGLVLVESMACGTPVVGSDVGAIPEVIGGPELGTTFSGDDSEAVARALLEGLDLAQDPGTAAACRAHAGRYSAVRCADAYEALYSELLDVG